MYLEATRMVSVMWRGAPIDLVALPTAHSIAVTRFGVDLDRGNAVCITERLLVPHVRFVVRTRVMCQAGRARTASARGDIVAWMCERAPLWVVVHVRALLRAY